MNQELVKCPCCERMVNASSIELTFKKPDYIAAMSAEDIEERCRYNDDIYICDGELFYIRCILPLPVQDKGSDYCLGVWVQVSESSFEHIYNLWDEEDLTSEEPLKGLLANQVPLNDETKGVEVTVQLIGATARPIVTVKDISCSLYNEQTCGVTIHRASEYSDLCR